MGGDFFSNFWKGGDFENEFGKPCSNVLVRKLNCINLIWNMNQTEKHNIKNSLQHGKQNEKNHSLNIKKNSKL